MLIYLIHAGFSNKKIPYIGEMISLNYMSSLLKENGYKTKVVDCYLEGFCQEDIMIQILQNNPSMLAISFYESNQIEVVEFVRALRLNGYLNAIVFIGIYATLNTKYLLDEMGDAKNIWCIRGEPEEVILEFAEKIKKGSLNLNVDKIVYKVESLYINLNHVNIVRDNNTLPYPDCTVMDRMYKKENVSAYILSSRGCYGNCSFCVLNIYNSCVTGCNNQPKWRERNVASVADEMEILAQRYPNTLIKFADSNFMGCNPNRGIELSKELKRRNLKSKFAIECRANDVEKENFRALKEVGLVSVFLGIESGSNNVLKRYNKEISIQKNQEAIDIIRELKIGLKIGFILFDEYSTLNELEENTEFLHKNRSCVFHPYRPLIIEKYRVNGRDPFPTMIKDEKARLAYEIIKETCQKMLPYRATLNKHRKNTIKKDADYRNSVYAIFGKFILFDKHGMDLLLSMCRDSSSSTMHIKAEFMTFVKQFLDDIEIDLRKLEVY